MLPTIAIEAVGAVAGEVPHVVKRRDDGLLAADLRQSHVAEEVGVPAVDIHHVGLLELLQARQLVGADAVDVVQPQSPGDHSKDSLQAIGAGQQDEIIAINAFSFARDSGFNARPLQRAVKLIHGDHRAASLCAALLMNQQYFHRLGLVLHGDEHRPPAVGFASAGRRERADTDQINNRITARKRRQTPFFACARSFHS